MGLDTGTKIFISANKSRLNDIIAFNCRKLKKANLITKYWFYSGSMNLKENENAESVTIQHLNDLQRKFPDFKFDI